MQTDDNDIAIVGMAIRVPGASTPEQYWTNLRGGVESLSELRDETLLARGVSRSALADPNYVRAAMELAGVDQFDPEFFGFSAKEAAILDPQHRQFYEVCWEALERAGHPPARFDGAIGVFAGCGMGAYFAYNILSNSELLDSVGLFLLRHTGNDKDFLATRVSYSFDLKGPSVNVQTACSTSLVATHLAVQSLLSGETDMALAGGVTIEVPHGVGYFYKEGEILSPDGHCRAFDHRSKGTVFGSGAGVVVLRRLADALADGDHIHAVIKGTAVNNDGSGKVGYLAPSVEGQAAAIAEALAVADVNAATIGYVECHGTGTPVGDPIEIAALTRAFRESTDKVGYCRVGSVKSNIGHLDTAAGVASLIKTALALEHGQIPPTLNFEAPNPAIAFDGSPFVVASALHDWKPIDSPRRACVNSLGVGGTNAFAVLQEPPKTSRQRTEPVPQALVLSARSRRALDDSSRKLAGWLRENADTPLADIAYTLMVGRHGFEHRRVLGCTSHAEAADLLEQGDARRVYTHTLEVERPNVVFMYPGGGAQYFRMGRDLYEREPVFRKEIDAGLALLKSRFRTDLTAVFLAEEAARESTIKDLGKPSVQLPLTFLVEYALTRLLEHYGVAPTALLGHSMGENTAACVAGVISFEDALGLVLLRGQLMDEVPEGGMLSVPMPADELRELLGSELDLAAANGPQLSVASGHNQLLDQLAARLAERGIESQRVRINIAAHSRMLENITGRFRAYLASIQLREPRLPIVSNRTGTWLAPELARSPDYWVEHLRNTVLFGKCVETLLEKGDSIFIEVGPGSTLGSFVRQNQKAPAQRVFGSMRHPDADVADTVHFRAMLGRVWAVGGEVAIDQLWAERPQRVPLPTYAFQHASYWIEPGQRKAADDRDLLRPLRSESLNEWFFKPQWIQQGVLDKSAAPQTWWVFHEREPLATRLLAYLRDSGHRVVSIQAGDTYAELDPTSFTLAPDAGGAGYQELVDTLTAAGLAPERILHTWLLTWDDTHRPGSSFFHRNQNFGFYSLFYLARALSKSGTPETGTHLLVVTNGVQSVAGEIPPFPEKATAAGPCAVIPRELPNVTCSFIDVDLGAEPHRDRKRRVQLDREARATELAKFLADELEAVPASTTIAWRHGVRWQRQVVPATLSRAAVDRLKRGGVYLITGGLGGIGGLVADWLARTCAARLVLLGRTPLPARDQWDDWLLQHDVSDSIARSILRIRELEALGAEVLVAAADVTVADQVRQAIAETHARFGAINGVFHAAGVIRDNLIPLKSQRDIEEVFSAKVYGTLVLDELLQNEPLDFVFLFSSISAFTAPQGQIDYVGANAFMNAFAEARRGKPYPVIAANWGIWRDVGMVTPAPASGAAENDAEILRGTRQELEHPLFACSYAARDGLLDVRVFEGVLSAERHWVIDEHRLIGGEALLPGTGYAELVRSALAELDETVPWRIANLVFQRPLFVRDGSPRKFRVRLRGGRGRWDAEVLAAPVRGQTARWDICASARVVADAAAVAQTLPLESIEARLTGASEVAAGSGALRTSQEAHLRFGKHWRVLKRIAYGSGEALARLELAEPLTSELTPYKLHPGLLDIATGCAMNLIPGYAEQDAAENLWVPISYRGLRYFGPLEGNIVSWLKLGGDVSRDAGFASFDVTIAAPDGRVLVEVTALTLRRLQGTLRASELDRPAESMETAEGERLDSKRQKLSPSELALYHNLSQGIRPEEGVSAVERLLTTGTGSTIVSSIKPRELLRQAEAVTAASTTRSGATFSRPELDSDFEAPRNDVERALAEVWGKLLGVEGIGIRDSFFDLGGHSLIAVRLFNEINDRYGVDLPMSVLMQRPTIAGLAEMLGPVETDGSAPPESAAAKQPGLDFRYVVPMHAGPVAGETPLFIVAGMFGNVLNLSHLAHLLGEARPVYAIQARGLYGDSPPHENFEEMAADYLEEVKKVQPKGPYLLGGYSGGGIAAYEMARQLLSQGESVAGVILMDTPLPRILRFSALDNLLMRYQRIRRGGFSFVREKVAEKLQRMARGRVEASDSKALATTDRVQFQSDRIGQAFVRAVEQYDLRPVPVKVFLFRPKLTVAYTITKGRKLGPNFQLALDDNGWTPHVASIRVFEVPGDHDGMVLEPNVRVLVGSLRHAVEGALSGR
jgi:acyl transferase domain-containing protein/thioesterase domain-containing protein/acyl carrier protein